MSSGHGNVCSELLYNRPIYATRAAPHEPAPGGGLRSTINRHFSRSQRRICRNPADITLLDFQDAKSLRPHGIVCPSRVALKCICSARRTLLILPCSEADRAGADCRNPAPWARRRRSAPIRSARGPCTCRTLHIERHGSDQGQEVRCHTYGPDQGNVGAAPFCVFVGQAMTIAENPDRDASCFVRKRDGTGIAVSATTAVDSCRSNGIRVASHRNSRPLRSL